MKISKRHYPLLILIFCGLIFLPHLGILPVNIMEARNFISAREMVFDGNWILTTLNGEPRYEKPPLPTWLTAFSGMLFGWERVAGLRLPAVLMAILASLSIYALGKKLTGRPDYGLTASLLLITSFYFTWAGRNGQWDIFTHAFMIVGVYCMVRWWSGTSKPYTWAVFSGIFLGFSFLSKGPVSLYALFLPFLIAYGTVYRFGAQHRDSKRRRMGPLLAFLITSLVLSSWWHLYIYFFDTHAAQEITSKEINNWKNYNIRPFYYYWNFFIQSGTWTILAFAGLLYPYLKDKVFHRKAYSFTLIWTLAAVVLLSLIPEKKSRYLLPVLLPLAMNTAFYLEYLIQASWDRKLSVWEKWPVWIQFGLISIVGLLVPFAGYWYLKDQLKGYEVWFIFLSISLVTLGIIILRALIKKSVAAAFHFTLIFMVAVVMFGLPISRAITHNPDYQGLDKLLHWQNAHNIPVFEFDEASPEMIWDFGKPIPLWQNTLNIDRDTFGLLAMEESREKVMNQFHGYKVEKIGYFDINTQGRSRGGHRSRLYRDFYLITK